MQVLPGGGAGIFVQRQKYLVSARSEAIYMYIIHYIGGKVSEKSSLQVGMDL